MRRREYSGRNSSGVEKKELGEKPRYSETEFSRERK